MKSLGSKLITLLYKFFGIFPIKLNDDFKARESKKFKKYSIFLFAVLSMFVVNVFYRRDYFINKKQNNAGDIVDFIQLVIMRASSVVIICEAFVTRDNLIIYFNNLHEVDILMSKIHVKLNLHKEQSKSFIITVAIMLFYIICELNVLFMYYLRDRLDIFTYWIFYTPFYIYCCLRYLQLINFILIIKRRIDIVNEKLKEIQFLYSYTQQSIENLREICYKLHVMSTMINITFGLSTLINIANDFITVTLNSYFIFVSFQNIQSRSVFKIIESISWSFPHCMNIIALATCCQLTYISTFKTAMFLHRISFDVSNKQHSMLMSQFSLQLLHQKIQFHAFGFFNIDFTLLYAIAATVTTYLVILIQFHLSEEYKGTEMKFT